ncbi:hypothetical protein WA158_000156 [Blastocystis sp. Blastoise]
MTSNASFPFQDSSKDHYKQSIDQIIQTLSPTSIPTSIPTLSPTSIPTIPPTIPPTLSPTIPPTIPPTPPPSLPIEYPQIYNNLVNNLNERRDIVGIFWRRVSNYNSSQIISILDYYYPLQSEYIKYIYRSTFFHISFNKDFESINSQYTSFPDDSYYWFKSNKQDYHPIYGTYYMQHRIWKHQFRSLNGDMNNNYNIRYLFGGRWKSGFGSVMHVFTCMLAVAINQNRVLMYIDNDYPDWIDKDFCTEKTYNCYFSPITNITFDGKSILSLNDLDKRIPNFRSYNRYEKMEPGSDNDQYVYAKTHSTPFLSRPKTVPKFVQEFCDMNGLIKEECAIYWRIQAIAFLTRMNPRTIEWIKNYRKENCPQCQDSYDADIHIRHGDKFTEMPLVDNSYYFDPVIILCKYFNKEKMTVFINADENRSIQELSSYNNNIATMISYNNPNRNNQFMDTLKTIPYITLISLANLYESLYSPIHIGTYGSNWNRYLFELKQTIGYGGKSMFLEVGKTSCISYVDCKNINTDVNGFWR